MFITGNRKIIILYKIVLLTGSCNLPVTMKSLATKNKLLGYQPCQMVGGKQTNVLINISFLVIRQFPDNKQGNSSQDVSLTTCHSW